MTGYNFEKIVIEGGDIFNKAAVRLLECLESVEDHPPVPQADAARARSTPGSGKSAIGEGIGQHEAPRGEVIHYIRANGSNYPERHKIRAPSFMNVPSFKKTVIGESIADAALITAAVDPCYCCTERMAVVDPGYR